MAKKGVFSVIRENVKCLRPYEVRAYPCKIKLDANESPFSPFPLQRSRLNVNDIFQRLNRYPDPEAVGLKKLVSRMLRVRVENILHGNGSDELIYYLITTFGGPVMYPVPTFSMYGVIAQALGEKRIEVPLDKDFDLDTDKILKAVKRYRPKLMFLSSPNNPTGNCFSSEKILKIIKSKPLASCPLPLVVIDEAYQPFSNKRSLAPLIRRNNNVAVMRTLSKIGLAGLRVGFIVGNRDIIKAVNRVRLPFNLNSLSQAIAMAVMGNREIIKSNVRLIISERKRLFKEMRNIKGVYPYPSDANFILFKAKNPQALFNGLIKKGILIRNMNGTVNGCLRVTVGTPRENTIFLDALRELSGAQNKRRR